MPTLCVPGLAAAALELYVPDWLPSLLNAGRAFVLIGAVELLWVATAWPNGGSAIVVVAVVLLLISPKGELAYGGAIALTLGAIAAISIAAGIKFAVLPAIETFPAFCLALGAFLLPAGVALAQSRHPALLAIWTAMVFHVSARAPACKSDELQHGAILQHRARHLRGVRPGIAFVPSHATAVTGISS